MENASIMALTDANCRLYLQVPAPLTARLESQLTQALASTSATCVLLCEDVLTGETGPLDRIVDLVQGAGAACLTENDIEAAKQLGTDGVHIAADPALYARARSELGESASIGAACGLARHDAMSLAEAGAEYIAFGQSASGPDASDADDGTFNELVAWWSEVFVVPCVAWNVDDPDRAKELAACGADFIAPSPAIWQNDGAVSALRDIDTAIGQARTAA